MRYEYNKQIIDELASRIKQQGYRVFIAERGTYGFFTDKDGARIIDFSSDLETTFSGNYKTDNPKSTGTGWRISDSDVEDYSKVFNAYPPHWAVGNSKWSYTTLEQHLATYQKSSKYTELEL